MESIDDVDFEELIKYSFKVLDHYKYDVEIYGVKYYAKEIIIASFRTMFEEDKSRDCVLIFNAAVESGLLEPKVDKNDVLYTSEIGRSYATS